MSRLTRESSRSTADWTAPSSPLQKFKRTLFPEIPKYDCQESLPLEKVVDDRHPLGLGNPKILLHLFKYLSVRDLFQIRRVSLRWNKVACEHLRYRSDYCRIPPSKLKAFLKLMKQCICNPFGSYAMRIENLNEQHVKTFFRRFFMDIYRLRVRVASEEIPEFAKLLNRLGNLEELHLLRIPDGSFATIQMEYQPDFAWDFGAFHFPNLKVIIFDSDDSTIPFLRNYDACFWNVINSAPNLIKVQFRNYESHLARVLTRCGISNPKSLDGWNTVVRENKRLKEDINELVFQRQMKFKALKFHIDEKIKIEFVMDVLLKTANTLFHVSLKNYKCETLEFTMKLYRLLTLNIQGWVGPTNVLSFKDNFPNLQTLRLRPSHLKIIPENFDHPLLKNLRVLAIMPLSPKETDSLTHDSVLKATLLFPGVTELYIRIQDDESLHVVYARYPNLEFLCADLDDSVTDESITGIPVHCIKNLGNLGASCECPKLFFPSRMRRKTYMGNLKRLKTLLLRSSSLTSFSLTQGIVDLIQLEKLLFLPSASAQISGSVQKLCLREIWSNLKKLRSLAMSKHVVYKTEELEALKNALPWLQIITL